MRSSTDESKEVSKRYSVKGIPTTVIIDKDGIVRSYTVGYRSEDEIRSALVQVGIE